MCGLFLPFFFVYCKRRDVFDDNGNHFGYKTEYKYTELTSQEALDEAGIDGRYLGEVVVVFHGASDETLGDDATLTGEGAKPAQVTIYGRNGADDIKCYNGLSVSSDKNIYPMIVPGEYRAYHEQMASSVYRNGSYTYRITTMNGGTRLQPVGDINKYTKTPYISDVFFHRTDWNGTASKSSKGCLVIDGRSWKSVEKQVGQSKKIYIRLIRD